MAQPCLPAGQTDRLAADRNERSYHFVHNRQGKGFPSGSMVKNPPANAEDTSSIPGSGRPPGGGNGNPFQYSCLGNPVDGGAWWAVVNGVTKSHI